MTPTSIDITRYTYGVTWPACTQEEALHGLRDPIAEVVEDLNVNGQPLPDPLSSSSYSGKFNLSRRRTAPSQTGHRSCRRTPKPQPVRRATSSTTHTEMLRTGRPVLPRSAQGIVPGMWQMKLSTTSRSTLMLGAFGRASEGCSRRGRLTHPGLERARSWT